MKKILCYACMAETEDIEDEYSMYVHLEKTHASLCRIIRSKLCSVKVEENERQNDG